MSDGFDRTDSGETPRGLVPDRTSVPNPRSAEARDALPSEPPAPEADDLELDLQAPGRPTHGANNNP